MKVEMYAHGESPNPNQRIIFGWLKNDHAKNGMKAENLWRTQQSQDDLIRELMARQDRQGKWIVFLMMAWAFSGIFIAFAVLMVR